MRLKMVLVAAFVGLSAGRMCFAAPAAAAPAASAAAVVNGEDITYDEYIATLETLPPPAKNARSQVAGARALEQLVGAKLLLQMADKEGVPATDEQLDKRVQEMKGQGNIQAMLQSRYQTPQEWKKELRGQIAYVNLAVKYAGISDSEVEDYYFKNKTKFNLSVRVKVGAILNPSKEKIETAQAKLKSGADFADVVKEFSEDPTTKKQGGILGWVWPNQQGVPGSVVNTAMGLAAGAVSQPLQIQGQWVILKAIERQAPQPRPLEEVRETCRELLALDWSNRKPDLKNKIADFRKTSDIQILVKRFAKDFAAALKADVEEAK